MRIKQALLEFGLQILGLALLCLVILIYRGTQWFTLTAWEAVTTPQWIIIGAVAVVFLMTQYVVLVLLRIRLLRLLVFLGLPFIWLFNNGLIVLHRLIQSQAGDPLTAWIPLTDLFGWVLAAIYFPLLLGGGAVSAILDGTGTLLTDSCRTARVAMDALGMTERDTVTWIMDYAGQFRDLITDSFIRQVRPDSGTRPFLDLSLRGVFALPYWFFTLGYSFTCLI